jgi:hypothetical protein
MKNYTTTIEPAKTLQEIITLIGKRGKAEQIIVDYDNSGNPEAIMFTYKLVQSKALFTHENMVFRFRLPCRWQGVLAVLKRKCPPRYQSEVQAKRVAWRLLKDWLDAQLCLIEAGAATIPEIFLPYCIESGGKQTLYEAYLSSRQQLKP